LSAGDELDHEWRKLIRDKLADSSTESGDTNV